MAKTTQGIYTFEDGYTAWFAGLSGSEKKMLIIQHGKVVKFTPTKF